jgi:hypothetical protein
MSWLSEKAKEKKKQVKNVVQQAVVQPTKAVAKAVQTKSISPITKPITRSWDRNIKQPINKAGASLIRPTVKKAASGLLGTINNPPAINMNPPADVSTPQLTFASPEQIAAQEKALATTRSDISSRFGALGSLAKMREQGQAMSDQTAIQRRLAASGMSGSGAGMRMQGQADQASARRLAEQQLGISADEAGAQLQAGEMSKDRDFKERAFTYQKEQDARQMELDRQIGESNAAVGRANERYNKKGFLGQLGEDIFGSEAQKWSWGGRNKR